MKKYLFSCLAIVLFCFITNASAQTRHYVKEGGTSDGTTWGNASGDLQAMINISAAGDQVWVAAGTYYPVRRADALNTVSLNDRDNAFVLKADVKIYGGFAGNESELNKRDSSRITTNTILSGDLGVVGDNTDNAYHVVISAGAVGTAELNGFSIVGGNANGDVTITVSQIAFYPFDGGGIINGFSSPILTNLTISGNNSYQGGGIFNSSSSPALTNVIISGNNASFGGGIYNVISSSPVLTNVTIIGNSSSNGNGGGIYNVNTSSPILTNVTISGNNASYGGGISNHDASSPNIRNTIIYGNSSGVFNDPFDPSSPVITYSLVQGSTDETNGNISGANDPSFVDPRAPGLSTEGNYRLQAGSPAIDKGNNSYLSEDITTDLDGKARIQNGIVDLGAYEEPFLITPTNGIVYVTVTGNGNFTGSSWANATNDLQKAINGTSVQQVWVAGGTYKPKYRADNMSDANANDPDNAFVLKADVKIYGGFAGNESELNKRDSSRITNNTILSGDLGAVGDITDNAYHVVISAGEAGAAELNGFSIKDAYAFSLGNDSFIVVSALKIYTLNGGGIYNSSSSPTLTNLTITNNISNFGGAIRNEYSSPILLNVIINGNRSDGNGGGISNYFSFPVLNDVVLTDNNASNGGGIANENSSPTLTNVYISGNYVPNSGGGIYNYSFSSPVLTNVTISGNRSLSFGGGIANINSSPILTNVTISGNYGRSGGGGIINSNSSPKIRNTIIYGNSTGIGNIGNSAPEITYSLVQDLPGGSDGNINGSTDPSFVDQLTPGLNTGGNYRLQSTSPAIDKGNNSYLSADITTDLDGKARIQNGIVDLGAYEEPFLITPTNGIVYVTVTGNGNFTGSSWANATNDLQKAIDGTSVQQVWVAGGTYKPKYRADNMSDANANDRDNAFVLKADVKIYGGFAGNESELNKRDSSRITNNTILSGDLGAVGDNTDNAYHVVISAGAVGTAELNGFSIVGGNANGDVSITVSQIAFSPFDGGGIINGFSSPILTNLTISGNNGYQGGGIFNSSSSPALTNVIISGNNASFGGGIYNEYSSSPVLTNVTIIGNSSSNGNGGGIYNVNNSSPILTNVTISGNNASYGGGISNHGASSPNIRNTIIYGNSSGVFNDPFDPSSPVITFSLVQGSTDETNGNISGANDPLFVQPLAPGLNTGGDYHLQDGSPVINKGNNGYFTPGAIPDLSAIKTDLDGKNRFRKVIDFGAYEYGAYVLPVEVVNYTAQAEGSSAKLKWTTATESNNKAFIISRSADGTNFKEIGSVAGAGNTSAEKDYVYYDENPLTGINFYQLSQMDYDGHKTDVGVRTVNFSIVGSNLIKVYPNPVKNTVKIEFAAGTYRQAELTDVNGKILQRLSLSTVDTEKKIDMSSMPSGIYFIKLSGSDKVESRKVMKE